MKRRHWLQRLFRGRLLRLLGLVLLAGLTHAEAVVDAQQQPLDRKQLNIEREQVESRFIQQQRTCAERFSATSCVVTARAERRAALARLREHELALDEALRKRRTAHRVQALQARTDGSVTPRHEIKRPRFEVQPTAPAASEVAPRRRIEHADAVRRAERRARNEQRFKAKQLEAQAHRTASQQRNQARAQNAKASKPLPNPSASAP